MGTELFTLTPDTVVGSALRLATSKRVHHFLVIEDGNLTGIVCQSDLRQARETSLVGTCMKTPVLCIGPETTVRDAADIMEQNEVGCLPVVTGAFLVGMITRDKLSRVAGVEEGSSASDDDLLLEDPEAKEEKACSSCGKTKDVRPYYRASMLHLCADCAAILPKTESPQAN